VLLLGRSSVRQPKGVRRPDPGSAAHTPCRSSHFFRLCARLLADSARCNCTVFVAAPQPNLPAKTVLGGETSGESHVGVFRVVCFSGRFQSLVLQAVYTVSVVQKSERCTRSARCLIDSVRSAQSPLTRSAANGQRRPVSGSRRRRRNRPRCRRTAPRPGVTLRRPSRRR